MTTLLRSRPLRLAAFAAGAIAVAGSAAWVTASAAGYNLSVHGPSSLAAAATPDKTSKPSTVCADFITHFTSDLGSNTPKFNAALQKAVAQTLADEVKNKDITQAQADAITKQLAGKAPCDLITAPRIKVPSAGTGTKVRAYQQAFLSAAASALGITDKQLMTDLANGMTLAQIAAAQNPQVTENKFRSRLIAKLTPVLDKAVTDKQMTSAQEQAILKQLQTGPIPYWNTTIKKKVPTA
jgi:hypothetical protein